MKKKSQKQEITKIKIEIDTPNGTLTYECSNARILCNIEKQFEKHPITPWSVESFMIKMKAPIFTLTVHPLGLTSTSKDWFTLEVRKK